LSDDKKLLQFSLMHNNIISLTRLIGDYDILIEAEEEENSKKISLKFTISDTGIGISKDVQENIFKPFIQGDLTYSKKYQGTGLGLAICKNLIEMLGGKIEFESEENKGTKFEFILILEKFD